ncbi:MAG: galactose-1-phosphate uridylyltransferase [Elusimicrobia bacterium CG_4_10_14_0_2_um_filter_56_8]|nr:MAG: galactose-1-phosphate uridylyltransferase [Elusimicrobia bacterium CG1_02_56_21]PJA15443.1 MAG: galactose-1-phosphate uridylyltransferase [Elusimicrobia bacterium CG_4_10_14_0_2_um_filter_56_8]
MPEIRKDPVFGRWVIIASERGLRPNDFRLGAHQDGSGHVCPFCAGNEDLTPPVIYSLPGAAGSWRLRVVRNKYPALTSEGSSDNRREGIYNRMDGMGFHEVVIETPDHGSRLEELSPEAMGEVLNTFILRVKEIKKDPRIKYVMIFKNHGRNAGASLMHPHSQIIAMPMAPLRVAQEIDGAAQYYLERGTCVFCDIVTEETAFRRRVVAENPSFLAVAPYASRFSFETWILPKKHASHFENMPENETGALAEILKDTLRKLSVSLPDLSYNLIVHTMPVREPEAQHYHWHIEIMPKLTHVAGFEWGTGFYINTVSPEDAAEILNSGKTFKI